MDVMIGTAKAMPWEFQEYKPAKLIHKYKSYAVKLSQKDNMNMFDMIKKRESLKPSPMSYDTMKPMMSTKKYLIPKQKKVTLWEEIANSKDKTPGPGFYKVENKPKILGTYK